MPETLSEDIQAIIDWEINHNDNHVVSIRSPWGKPVVLMNRALKKDQQITTTVKWWECKSLHWDRADWVAGWESTISGDKVCVPIE